MTLARATDAPTLHAAAVEVAEAAGARALEWWHRRASLVVEQKGKNDWVSAADRDVERFIVDALGARFGDAHAFLGEEGGRSGAGSAGKPLWVIDPIDGTTNFLRGIPLFAVSIAAVVDGAPVVGAIRLPLQGETFAAARGRGATLNGAPIAPSAVARLDQAVVTVGSNRKSADELAVNNYRGLIAAGVEPRRLGSACVAICYAACGRVDAYVEPFLNAWDVAAGLVIVEEAGGRANDFATGSWLEDGGALVVGAPGVFDDVRRAAAI